MAKLRTIRPKVAKLAPMLLAPRVIAEKQRLAERDETNDWRKWYYSARWQALREEVLRDAAYTCQKTGILLMGKHPAPDSPVVDHIVPHRGNPDLFWDRSNLQAVSRAFHDSIKQAIENAEKTAAIHPKWLKPSLVPLTIVCGPPASGKSTYVRNSKGPDDLVIDLDVIASDISGEPLRGWNRSRWLNAALYRRNNMLGDLGGRGGDWPAAWLIVSEPKARHRDWWAVTLKPQQIVVMEVLETECMRRAAEDPGRDLLATEAAVTRWWVEYDRRIGDVRVTI
ncbi:AAA family ATPase [Haematobacter genomosp. 1]|uniref:AAA family ATPase n=1 Tax=Haematobacter genomosp. 1 TaxID=366618 RepID=UPI00117A01FA|nr:AAA family ATPase [Haematobacter genomosp. 1]